MCKPARAGTYQRGRRFDRKGDCGKAGLILQKTAASLNLLNLGPNIGQLSLNGKGILDAAGLLHDLHELRLKRLLGLDSGLEIDVLLGNVLSGDPFLFYASVQSMDCIY